MRHHPIADIWPMMDQAQLQDLADDIKKNGQLQFIWLYEGMILDGRNRYAACQLAGIQPKTKDYTGDEPTAFAVSLNDKRRHMNKGSLAAVAVELLPFFEADAKKRLKASGGDKKSIEAKSGKKFFLTRSQNQAQMILLKLKSILQNKMHQLKAAKPETMLQKLSA